MSIYLTEEYLHRMETAWSMAKTHKQIVAIGLDWATKLRADLKAGVAPGGEKKRQRQPSQRDNKFRAYKRGLMAELRERGIGVWNMLTPPSGDRLREAARDAAIQDDDFEAWEKLGRSSADSTLYKLVLGFKEGIEGEIATMEKEAGIEHTGAKFTATCRAFDRALEREKLPGPRELALDVDIGDRNPKELGTEMGKNQARLDGLVTSKFEKTRLSTNSEGLPSPPVRAPELFAKIANTLSHKMVNGVKVFDVDESPAETSPKDLDGAGTNDISDEVATGIDDLDLDVPTEEQSAEEDEEEVAYTSDDDATEENVRAEAEAEAAPGDGAGGDLADADFDDDFDFPDDETETPENDAAKDPKEIAPNAETGVKTRRQRAARK